MASCAPPPWLPKHSGDSSCTGLSSISWIIVPQKMINKHEYHESTVLKKKIHHDRWCPAQGSPISHVMIINISSTNLTRPWPPPSAPTSSFQWSLPGLVARRCIGSLPLLAGTAAATGSKHQVTLVFKWQKWGVEQQSKLIQHDLRYLSINHTYA